MTSKTHKNVSVTLNYNEHLFILASTVTGCFHFCWYAINMDM